MGRVRRSGRVVGKSLCSEFPAPWSSFSPWRWKPKLGRVMELLKCFFLGTCVCFKASCTIKMDEGRVPCPVPAGVSWCLCQLLPLVGFLLKLDS